MAVNKTLVVQILRLLARAIGADVKQFDVEVKRLDAMTPEEREKNLDDQFERLRELRKKP